MFSHHFWAGSILVIAWSLQVQGHALITPALGVNGKGVRNDVQRPSANDPCGKIDIAVALSTTTPVNVTSDGLFTMTVINFNGGGDGSRQVATKVDATGTGKKFVDVEMTKNGQKNPGDTGSEKVIAKLPSGTKCTGGKTKDLCLASVTTTAGFGNCVVIQQGNGAKASGKKVVDPTGTDRSADSRGPGSTNVGLSGSDSSGSQGLRNEMHPSAVGTRAPRYIRHNPGL